MLNYNVADEKKAVEDRDPLFNEAVDLILETGKASTTFIQRKLMVGYARSAKILDEIEEVGIIGPSNGAKPRDILITGTVGQWQIPTPPPEPKIIEEEIPQIKWNKTKYSDDKSDQFEINLGVDENNKTVNFNLERYGNLLIIGSQFTSSVDLLNNILAESMAKYSPEELRIIAVDGIRGDLIIPRQASHLLTPLIVDMDKSTSALKWAVSEVQRRMKDVDFNGFPKIIFLINSLNQLLMFSPEEIEDNIYQLLSMGKKYGIYLLEDKNIRDYLQKKFNSAGIFFD